MTMPDPPPGGADQTRRALIDSGLKLFGAKGFAGTSTREIAGDAGTNIASIAYHFGSKDGLRRAIAEWIAGALREVIDAAFADGLRDIAASEPAQRPAQARAAVTRAIGRVAEFLLASRMGALFPRFVVREMAEPSAAFDVLYAGVFEPAHRRLCELFALATGGDPESEETRLTVFALIGPLLYFRIGAPAVLRRMDWDAYGPEEVARVTAVIARLVGARIEEKDKPT